MAEHILLDKESAESGGGIVMTKTTRFDAADYLDTEERQVAYVTATLESGDADFVRDALGLVARARVKGATTLPVPRAARPQARRRRGRKALRPPGL